jgi:hypothetical protein
MQAFACSRYEGKYTHKKQTPSPIDVVKFWAASVAIVAASILIALKTDYLNHASRHDVDGRTIPNNT